MAVNAAGGGVNAACLTTAGAHRACIAVVLYQPFSAIHTHYSSQAIHTHTHTRARILDLNSVLVVCLIYIELVFLIRA